MSVAVLIDDLTLSARGSAPPWTLTRRIVCLASEHDDDKCHQSKHGGESAQTNDADDRDAVPSRHRIVVKAVKQQRVDRRTDRAARRFDDGIAQIARTVLDAEQVPGEPPVRREHDDSRRMSELF